jgi:NADH-quinone oxidoreductase subunit A
MSATSLAAYAVLFGSVGLLFLLVSLLIGRMVRPKVPMPAKLEAYECGEPAVGTSFVQFDLRFYVVALVFIVFEVEVALFFPPATIFGTATRWMNPQNPPPGSTSFATDVGVAAAKAKLGVTAQDVPMEPEETPAAASSLALAAAADLAAFFALILLGFAYVWRRGDLDWVRAIRGSPPPAAQELQLVRST